MRFVIAAAAGNIGRLVADHVLRADHEAVLLVRNPASLPPALSHHPRAQVVSLDLRDETAVVAAAAGADDLFWLVPPPPVTVLDWGA